ncbi:MAG: phage Gp37/Gp68 family protein [Actinomycetota bacterium]|nr:phage Gp37/Gp68 family protein [Actinomycetota bacterium]
MSIGTSIEWTDVTWNPTTGCRRVSEGCDNCYAVKLARRLKAMGNPRYQNDGPDGPGFGLTLHWDKIEEPLRWKKPRRVFVNSMSDLFHPSVPHSFVRRCFQVMVEAAEHEFQILTKRPTYMARSIPRILDELRIDAPRNIWLGTSVENQAWAEKRIPALLRTPAAVRFLSCEPLLGPVDLSAFITPDCAGRGDSASSTAKGLIRPEVGGTIDWVIVGGESGPGFRAIEADWVRNIRDECLGANIAFFMKQWGGRTPKAGGRDLDGRTWDQMPLSRRDR